MMANVVPPTSAYGIRFATADDFDAVNRIGQTAVGRYDGIESLAHLTSAVQITPAKFQEWLDNGRIYLATSSSKPSTISNQDQVIGFISVSPMDTSSFIGTASVDLHLQGKGIGGLLLKAVLDDALKGAKDEGKSHAQVSLMTYTEISWNAPWYAKFGFEIVDPSVVGPAHVARMKNDVEVRDMNRPGYTRCCMLWRKLVA